MSSLLKRQHLRGRTHLRHQSSPPRAPRQARSAAPLHSLLRTEGLREALRVLLHALHKIVCNVGRDIVEQLVKVEGGVDSENLGEGVDRGSHQQLATLQVNLGENVLLPLVFGDGL